METLKKIGSLMLGFAMVMIMFVACGPTQKEVDSVAEKIDNGASLTQSDYTVITDYCVEYAKKAQEYQAKLDAPGVSAMETSEYTTKLADLTARYSYADMFFKALNDATPEAVGAENVKKIQDNAELDYFTAPSWVTIETSNDVSGFIEDMPDSDTAGVISVGDGVTVE